MTQKKVVLAGGTGFVGKYLTQQFSNAGYEVIIISRQSEHVQWHDTKGIIAAIDNSELLVNLAGKSVDCRYNKKNREEILKSRTETTKALGAAILQCENPPELWINSSTATIYRHAEDRPMSESTGEVGDGFSVGVGKSWEKAFFNFKLSKTRQVALRMAIVLGKNGGVMGPFMNLVRFGLGGRQGNGKQMFSWIHIADMYGIVVYLQRHKEMSGVYNCSSPNPVTNNILMKTLRRVMKMPFGLPTPKLLLKIGAVLINTETELILKSRWVVPERLIDEGYKFEYQSLEKAFYEIINK